MVLQLQDLDNSVQSDDIQIQMTIPLFEDDFLHTNL